jgi:formate--tetrahydrofolate ligase
MTDIDIAQQASLSHIRDIASKLNLNEDHLEMYGKYKAKLPLSLLNPQKAKENKLVLVSAISPTPAGEGKTTMSIGLTQALNRIGKQTTVVLREPSLGPVFGIKGGATGGGYSQVLPMEDINLHFNGDFAAVEKAHNLLAALIDNRLQNRKHPMKLDGRTIAWKRVMDMNDRSLRNLVLGLGGTGNGMPRESGFDITAASEIMAILCLSNDLEDLKRRLGNIYVGKTMDRQNVFARDLNAQGAMAALLKDAIKPNLVQTIEGDPAIIHGGPFANIAQGTNTVIATQMGLSLSDYVVTEAGFGFDLGGEKFLDIKCQSAGLKPEAIVLVATIRALKYHGGKPLDQLKESDPDAVRKGFVNAKRHIENARKFGIEPIIAINHFIADSDEEVKALQEECASIGAKAILAQIWANGGAGGKELAEAVVETIESGKNQFKPLYNWEMSMEEKINRIATEVYGASGVEYGAKAKKDLKTIDSLGLNEVPVCIAKTQKSFSDDPNLLGAPEGWTLNVREIEIAAGAGFVVPITGEMMRMPGLPGVPAAEHIDIDADGNISGLF